MPSASLSRLTWIFFRVGNLTFGGGDPTMAALQSELVATRRWLDEEQYGLVYGLARITPGTNLLAFCAAAGWLIAGWAGSVLGVLAVTLPSAIIVVLLTAGYQAWSANALALAAIGGTLAAAIGMMATSSWQLLLPALRRRQILRALVIFTASLVFSLRIHMAPIELLGLAALAGLIWKAPAEQ